MNKECSEPVLKVGQVWTVNDREIAIIGLSKHLAEYRRCHEGKVVCVGLSDLKSRASFEKELAARNARLTGHVIITDRLLQIGGARSPARRSRGVRVS